MTLFPVPPAPSILGGPCTKARLSRWLRNRGYRLDVTTLKKDRGMVKVYMFDRGADPMLFQIGEWHESQMPDWATAYLAAVERHEESKALGTRDG